MSPELYGFALNGSRLEETVSRQDVGAFRFITYVGRWYLFAVSLVFGLPFGLLVLAGKVDIWGPVVVIAFFGGVGIVLLILKSAVGIVAVRSRLPRTISVREGKLCIATPKENKYIELTNCKWYSGSTAADELCMFSGLRRGIVIQTPETQIACGHSAEMLDHWRNFLMLARIPENPPRGCLRIFVIGSVGMIFGILIGAGLGHIVSIFTKDEKWTLALGFMGVIEGAVVALIYATCTSEGVAAARKRLHPTLIGLAFFVIGMKFGAVGGLSSAFVCGSINAVFGALVAWLCRVKIRALEMEGKFATQLRVGRNERDITND